MRKKILYTLIAVVLIGVMWYVWTLQNTSRPNTSTEPVFCTQEAKLCPDGSYVGRTGPNCEFAPCPSETLCEGGPCPSETFPNDWKTMTDTSTPISFHYPEQFTTIYIHTVDWPPKFYVKVDAPFSCDQGGSVITENGKTELHTVDGKEYCVTLKSEGAAGSIYTYYKYEFSYLGMIGTFVFSTREVQCANYDDPKKTECEQERMAFDIDSIMLPVINSIQ